MIDILLRNIRRNQSVRLKNLTCPYCGVDINKENNSKDHVIGRKFVPVGSFENQWNLIVQACKCCNNKKSDLEDDISALTLNICINDVEVLSESAMHKTKSKIEKCISRQTNTSIKNSSIHKKISQTLNQNVEIKFNYQAPAQLNDERCFELARYHLMAFFYLISFDDKTMKGHFWPEGFYPTFQAPYSDWGNIQQLQFMNSISEWQPKFLGITANGFFKIIIRKHPSVSCWAWALEWNKSYRLVGFFGCQRTAQELVNKIPNIQWHCLNNKHGMTQYYRAEEELSDIDDILFNIKNA